MLQQRTKVSTVDWEIHAEYMIARFKDKNIPEMVFGPLISHCKCLTYGGGESPDDYRSAKSKVFQYKGDLGVDWYVQKKWFCDPVYDRKEMVPWQVIVMEIWSSEFRMTGIHLEQISRPCNLGVLCACKVQVKLV